MIDSVRAGRTATQLRTAQQSQNPPCRNRSSVGEKG
jgi:hypothetical protein